MIQYGMPPLGAKSVCVWIMIKNSTLLINDAVWSHVRTFNCMVVYQMLKQKVSIMYGNANAIYSNLSSVQWIAFGIVKHTHTYCDFVLLHWIHVSVCFSTYEFWKESRQMYVLVLCHLINRNTENVNSRNCCS